MPQRRRYMVLNRFPDEISIDALTYLDQLDLRPPEDIAVEGLEGRQYVGPDPPPRDEQTDRNCHPQQVVQLFMDLRQVSAVIGHLN